MFDRSVEEKTTFERKMWTSILNTASRIIFGTSDRAERQSMNWTNLQKDTWKEIKHAMFDEENEISIQIEKVNRSVTRYELLTTKTVEDPKDGFLPGTNQYNVDKCSAKSFDKKREKIVNIDIEIDEDVSKQLKKVKIHSRENGVSGKRGQIGRAHV